MASPPPSPRRAGMSVDLAFVRGSPARKLRAECPAAVGGRALPMGGVDRSCEAILEEQRQRVLRARQMRIRMGMPCSPAWDPGAAAQQQQAAKAAPSPPRPASPASVPASPALSQQAAYSADSAVQVRAERRDAATQTRPLPTSGEMDVAIARNWDEVAGLEREVQRLRIAAKGRVDDHRSSLTYAQEVFFSAHRQAMEDGVRTRRIFETSSLISLRDIEREQQRDALRQLRRRAQERQRSLDRGGDEHASLNASIEAAAAEGGLRRAVASPLRCPSPAPASPEFVISRDPLLSRHAHELLPP